jgi:hypothetical protein
VLVGVFALSACGSSGSTSSAPTSTTNPFENASWERATPNPSTSAKMICANEAREEIGATIGREPSRITKPHWDRAHHIYSCTYVFPRGKFTLSVKEMSSGTETTKYFDSVIAKYGKTQDLKGLGQGAWVLKNGDVVVRKDYKVLLVDTAGIPSGVGKFAQAMRRSDVAISVAAVIMSCWTGA